LQATQKKFRRLPVQPGLRSSNDIHVGQKMATFQLFLHSGQAKNLTAPLHMFTIIHEHQVSLFII